MSVNKTVQWVLIVAVLLLVTLSSSRYQAVTRGSGLHAWFFDIGQGDSELLDTPDGHQVLIDGGPDNTVLTRLSHALPLSDKEIDLIIVTHNHADHLAGINQVLEHYQVDNIWISGAIYDSATYKKFVRLVADKHIKTEIVTAGSKFSVSGLTGIALFPLTNMTGQKPDNPHDASVVTYWQYGPTSVMMTGDAETEAESAMLQKGIIKPATILKIGHHGSYTSSSESFLKAVAPKLAVISVGAHNKFGHPHQVTLDKLAKFHIPVLRTDQDGSIKCTLTETDYSCQPHS